MIIMLYTVNIQVQQDPFSLPEPMAADVYYRPNQELSTDRARRLGLAVLPRKEP